MPKDDNQTENQTENQKLVEYLKSREVELSKLQNEIKVKQTLLNSLKDIGIENAGDLQDLMEEAHEAKDTVTPKTDNSNQDVLALKEELKDLRKELSNQSHNQVRQSHFSAINRAIEEGGEDFKVLGRFKDNEHIYNQILETKRNYERKYGEISLPKVMASVQESLLDLANKVSNNQVQKDDGTQNMSDEIQETAKKSVNTLTEGSSVKGEKTTSTEGKTENQIFEDTLKELGI